MAGKRHLIGGRENPNAGRVRGWQHEAGLRQVEWGRDHLHLGAREHAGVFDDCHALKSVFVKDVPDAIVIS